jgi:two-component system, NtrC family, response regulator AtoC
MANPSNHGPQTSTVRATRETSEAGKLCLLIIGEGIYATHLLPESGTVLIGRQPGCDVVIDHLSISRRHAQLRMGPPMSIEDLGSANGTRVRGEWIKPGVATPFDASDAVDIGAMIAIVQHWIKPLRSWRLWSHGYFEARLGEECARAERTSESFVLAQIHCASAPPTVVEETLADLLQPSDIVGLYAPGEYEVLMTETSPVQAEHVVARVVSALAQRGARSRVGVACYPQHGRAPDSLLAAARAAATGGRRVEGATGALVVTDGAMQQLHRVVERVAAGTISVLILGETGVGKEVLAETVHKLSPRAVHPFLRLNCAALSESLLESELFGHERGAFTGAVQAKPGLLETAQGGTVFIDEIGELPVSIQVKLLRVIETRQVLRVGALKTRPIDVRFVAATNRDLEVEIERGTFRQDLFFRLNGISLVIPPLRERVGEIAGLARGFAAEVSRLAGEPRVPAIAPEAMAMLERYSWPGNIRELRNVIERAVLLCAGGPISLEHLPVEKMRATMTQRAAGAARSEPLVPGSPAASSSPARADPLAPPALPRDQTVADIRREMDALERERILVVLNTCGGNQTEAARVLGMSRRALVNRLDAWGVARPRKRPRP